MKYTFCEKKNNIKKRINIACELMCLAFVVCVLTLLVFWVKIKDTPTAKQKDEELVSVFKETELYNFFGFNEIEKTGEGVWQFNQNKTENKEHYE